MRFSRVASFCAFLTLNILSSLFSSAQVCNLSQIPSNLRNGLVAYYPFCGNANDVSGNSNTLQAFGLTATTDRFGNANSAYSFTNTQTSVTSYLRAANPTSFAKTRYSISVWFNSSQFYPNVGGVTYNYQSIINYGPQWYNYGPAYHLSLQHANNSILEGRHWTVANTSQGVTTANGTITTNRWYHAVMTYDGSSISLYLNGALVGTNTASLSYLNQIQFLIGGAGDGPSPGGIYGGFNGKLDDIGFWDRPLTTCEISQLYNQTSTAFPSQSSYFTFNSLSDTTRVCGTTTTLDAGSGYSSYLWNTGATTQTISPTANGKYFVTVTNASGCTASDTTNLILRGRLINESNVTACNFSNYQLSAKRNRGPLKYIGTYQSHDYFIDTISRKWSLARDTARINGSELWIINNLQENTHVYNNFLPFNANNSASYWAGLYQDLSASNFSEPGGGWKWLDGTTMTFSNWYTNEPNNTWAQGVAENFMHIKWSSMYFDKWNDVIEDLPAAGYLSYGISESNTPTYLWNTGATTSSITVSPTQTTTYYLTVTENGASCTDSVRLTVTGIQFSPLQDTTSICGTTTTLDAGAGFTTYNWNTGATTRTITPSIGGFYKVTVTNSAGCTTSDSTTLSLVKANILNNDTTICLGNSIRLSIDSIFPGRTSCTTSQLPEGLRTGLLAYYPFCGNANNAMGTGNNGTVYNATLTTDRFGVANSAYSFNGTNAYIDFGSNTSIGPTTTNPVSISLWVSGGATGNVISKYTNLDATNSFFYFSRSNNGYQWVGNGTTPYINNTGVTDSDWTHYVLVGVAGTNNSKVYRNGVLIASGTLAMNSTMRAVSLLVGRVGASFPGYLNGKVDDIFIYNRALTASDVQNLYLAQPTVTWSNGASGNSILVAPTQTTTFYVDVSDGIGTCRDSVRVTVSNIGSFNPLSDTTRVCGTSTILNAGSGYSTYSWSNGSTSQSNTLTTSGFYRVTVTNASGCTASDSTYLSLVNANIINRDTTICRGSSITLSIDSLFPGRTACNISALPSNLRNGLVGYWPFCGNANDASGNGNNGTVNGALLAMDRFQNQASAYRFNGIDNEISIPSTSQLNALPISISVWFKTNSSSRVAPLVNKYPCFSASGYSLHLAFGNPAVYYVGSNSTPGIFANNIEFDPVSPSPSVNDNQWHNLTYSIDISGVKYYLDGVLFFSSPWLNGIGTVATTLEPLRFGKYPIGNCTIPYFFSGDLDDVFIWNRALSASEIQQLYSSAPTVSWSTGATTNQIIVNPTQTTTYYATVTDGITTCTDSVRITVATVDTAVVVLDPLQVCTNGGQVRMQAGVASGYQWLRNGVAIPGATSRLYTATQTGSYRVALVNSAGCRDTSRTISVSLYPQPVSGFNINPNTQCFAGNQFSFTNTTTLSSGTITYLWNFGNGITSTQTSPSYSYPSTGTYVVKLVATSGTGCKDSTTRTITVNPSPTATFSVNTASQCVTGNQFSFTNNSSITTGTLTYAWTFGDGNVSTNANPSHSYINAGSYTVKLVVTSALGCKDSTTRSINVYAKPTVDFSVNRLAQCVNENSFVFTNNTTITSGTITYVWRFGDGNSATTTNATHSYLTAGTYVVKLIAVSNNGCSDSTTQTVIVNPKPTVDFSINNAAQCLSTNQFVFNNLSTITSGVLTHAWNFGNGATSIQTSPTYMYGASGVYAVKLVTTSAAGCRDSIVRSVTVHAMPTGTLNTPTTNLLCEGGTVSLSASGGTLYQWFINGGAIVGATSATYAANQPGTYTVNVISSNGCVAAATGAVTLQLVRKPTVNFTYDKYCAGFPTQFTDQSNTTNSNAVTYSWSFGQGQGNSTQQNPSYTFPTASTYSVSLTVTPVVCPSLAASVSKPVAVVAPPPNQRYTSLNAVENRNLQLEARVFGGATYSWNPSNGLNNSLISNPIFNYNAEVDYIISITTGIGCIIRDTQLVRIFKEKEIYVPKGFSPNGDGNNDKIFPRLVGVRSLTYFKVFNRWGQLIFMTTNINEGWDGTYKGVKQPMEGYVWIAEGIDFDNNTIKRTGTFLLLR